jgi:hypothetical protein
MLVSAWCLVDDRGQLMVVAKRGILYRGVVVGAMACLAVSGAQQALAAAASRAQASSAPAALKTPATVAAGRYPQPSAQETRRIVDAFKQAVRRSLGPRSGDIFVLPRKYCYVMDSAFLKPYVSRVVMNGQETDLPQLGNHHGTYWDYDTRIPLWLKGPEWFKAGRYEQAATQQDIVPTVSGILGVQPPEDARGRVLQEALRPATRVPRVVLVLVFDQGGLSLLDAHPDATPFLNEYFKDAARFTQARVTHIDPETIVGHAAIGTGAYPNLTGISANRPWIRQAGQTRPAVLNEQGPGPASLESPTLSDVWLRHTSNQAIVVSQSLADRAAIGMVGHGARFAGNKKPIVNYFDDKQGIWETNERCYMSPDYLRPATITPHWEALAGPSGLWMGNPINNPFDFKFSSAAAQFDGDAMFRIVTQEPLGADDVPDLIWWSLKATDYVSHRYGQESLQAREALQFQDQQARRVIAELERKVGAQNLLTVFTADHGGGPLVELTGGARLSDETLLAAINAQFDRLQNQVPLAQTITSTQVYLNKQELAANRVTPDAIKAYLKQFKLQNKTFFTEVFTRRDIEKP